MKYTPTVTHVGLQRVTWSTTLVDFSMSFN